MDQALHLIKPLGIWRLASCDPQLKSVLQTKIYVSVSEKRAKEFGSTGENSREWKEEWKSGVHYENLK